MCLCNGTGTINIQHSWGIIYQACPDSNCQFDRVAADKRYEDWKLKLDEYEKSHSLAV